MDAAAAAKAVTKIVVPLVVKPGSTPPDVVDSDLLQAEVLGWKFAQIETPQLTDQIARALRFGAALEKWVKAAKIAYQTRLTVPLRGLPVVTHGTEFMSVYSAMERADIDRELVKKDMGEEWYKAHCTTISYNQMSFKSLQKFDGESGGDETS